MPWIIIENNRDITELYFECVLDVDLGVICAKSKCDEVCRLKIKS
jgi:hypothetical protein